MLAIRTTNDGASSSDGPMSGIGFDGGARKPKRSAISAMMYPMPNKAVKTADQKPSRLYPVVAYRRIYLSTSQPFSSGTLNSLWVCAVYDMEEDLQQVL